MQEINLNYFSNTEKKVEEKTCIIRAALIVLNQ